MLNKVTVYALIHGANFKAASAESLIGLSFSETNEIGDIGKLGRYKDKPIPYASATLRPPINLIAEDNIFIELDWMVSKMKDSAELLRNFGADDIVVYLIIAYRDQCNFEIEPEILRTLGDINIPLAITCYQTDEQ